MKAGVLPQAYSEVKEKVGMGIRWGFGLREEVGLGGTGGYRGGEHVLWGGLWRPPAEMAHTLSVFEGSKEGDNSSPLCRGGSGRFWGLE